MGVLNKESCEARGSAYQETYFIADLEAIVNVMAISQVSQWQTLNGALFTILLVPGKLRIKYYRTVLYNPHVISQHQVNSLSQKLRGKLASEVKIALPTVQ